MNNFIKSIIEEKIEVKTKKSLKNLKSFKKDKTDEETPKPLKKVKKTVPKKETEIDEIIDEKGNIKRSKRPSDLASKGTTQKKTTDDVVLTAYGQMGVFGGGPYGNGLTGSRSSQRFWTENSEYTKNDILEIALGKTLGAKDTILQNDDYEDAEDHFEKELGMDDAEAEDRLGQLGYDKELPDDKVRLVENPKKFIEEFIESILPKKTKQTEFVSKNDELKDVNPIILKQIKSLKNSLESNELTVKDILKLLQDNE
jgi:flavodoxin